MNQKSSSNLEFHKLELKSGIKNIVIWKNILSSELGKEKILTFFTCNKHHKANDEKWAIVTDVNPKRFCTMYL